MRAVEIRKEAIRLREEIDRLKSKAMKASAELAALRMICPHPKNRIESWTNNDGDGQFTVNRCKNCGLQKDGPLSSPYV